VLVDVGRHVEQRLLSRKPCSNQNLKWRGWENVVGLSANGKDMKGSASELWCLSLELLLAHASSRENVEYTAGVLVFAEIAASLPDSVDDGTC
jgi:hypothetical protein